jgi:hypothetical protein
MKGESIMAKYERRLKGNFDEFLSWIHRDISNGSSSVSYEDGSDIKLENSRVAVRVYERYSMAGGNRVSMNVTIVGTGDELIVSAITSGGSQAVFFKMNTIGEETFLEICKDSVENYIRSH